MRQIGCLLYVGRRVSVGAGPRQTPSENAVLAAVWQRHRPRHHDPVAHPVNEHLISPHTPSWPCSSTRRSRSRRHHSCAPAALAGRNSATPRREPEVGAKHDGELRRNTEIRRSSQTRPATLAPGLDSETGIPRRSDRWCQGLCRTTKIPRRAGHRLKVRSHPSFALP